MQSGWEPLLRARHCSPNPEPRTQHPAPSPGRRPRRLGSSGNLPGPAEDVSTPEAPTNPRATMVCGGFSCSKNCLCALNLLYTVSSPAPGWHLRGPPASSQPGWPTAPHPSPLAGFPHPQARPRAPSPAQDPDPCLSQSPPVLHCGARPSPPLCSPSRSRISPQDPIPIPPTARSRLAKPSGSVIGGWRTAQAWRTVWGVG